MTSPDYYIPSTSDYNSYYIDSSEPPSHSDFNNKFMVVAIVILFCLILLISSLHIFGKWAWRRSPNRNSNRVLSFHAHFEDRFSCGLSKDAIAQLPVFTYKPRPESSDIEASEDAGPLECAVCLSEFQENEKGRLLPSCKHSFHIECIDMWFYSHSTCPLCRAVVVSTVNPSPSTPITISTHEHQQEADELALRGAQNTTSPTDESNRPLNAMAIPASDNDTDTLQNPTNTLSCGHSIQFIPAQLGSSQTSEKWAPLQSSSSSSSTSTRSVPHITIEIPRGQDINLTSPVCFSLSNRSSRCISPYDGAAYPSFKSLKSPGVRESVKRMLSIQSSKEGNNIESPKKCN